jgi:hypothetical protein
VIGLILAIHIIGAAPETTVTYTDVPPDVTRILVLEPRGQDPPRIVQANVERSPGRIVLRGEPHRVVVVTFGREQGKYLLDGPFAWPAADASRTLDRRWRRTIAGPAPGGSLRIGSLEWIEPAPFPDGQWPRCFVRDDGASDCWGVADGQRGVAIGRGANGLVWSVVADDAEAGWRASRWGRLLLVRDQNDQGGPIQIRFGRPVAAPPTRVAGIRVESAGVDGAVSVAVAPGAAWIAGSDVPPDSWLDVKTSRSGPVFLALPDLAAGPVALPVTIRVPESQTLAGLIVGSRNEPASSALLTVFRLIDPDTSGSERRKRRRVFAAEAIADATGRFQVEGIGEADYELVAFHPQLGRASSLLSGARSDLTIRLQTPGLVRGRVLAGGKPVAGVEITSVPDPDGYRNAEDLLDVKGGDARSGPDGRFAVMAAASGGGELRIGGGRLPVKRVPLPRVPLPIVDLGDIEIGAPIELTIALDQDTACGVRATGPVGRSGLQIVTATRVAPGLFQIVLPETGVWQFGLLCGREGRPLTPAIVQIGPEHAGKEVRLAIR